MPGIIELDVTHAHPGRIHERGCEEEAGTGERRKRPLRAQVPGGVRDEDDRRRRQDDPVRDDPVLEVDRRHGDENGAEERSDGGFHGETEGEDTAGNQERGDELDGRIDEWDPNLAVPAASTERSIGQQRHVVVPRDLLLAGHARRRRPNDRTPQRDAGGDDVQEAPKRQSGREDDSG
jgi:hypothetical protein